METTIDKNDEIVMKLLHYFITEENYTPIVLHGSNNEIWLENFDNDYKIVRIVSNYIHNEEIGLYGNTCYSGCGKTVAQDRIIDVIVL